jgi:hypothetical protein
VSIKPFGSGAGRAILAKASVILGQSNLTMLCPAHTLPAYQNIKQCFVKMYDFGAKFFGFIIAF